MKKLLLVLLICVVSHAKYLDGEANFLSRDGDSLSFIKKQLLSNAFKKVIDIELKQMGLDAATFWENYNAKFEEYFSKIKEGIDEKYQDKETGEVPENKQEQYQKVLRVKRLTAKSKFSRLSKAIASYSIKKLSKSVTLNNSHYVNVSAQVDRKSLTDIYYKYIGVSSLRTFRKFFVDVDYNLVGTNWLELGVESQNDFVNVVNGHWSAKLNDSLKEVFTDGLVIVNDTDRERIKERLKKSDVALSATDASLISEEEAEISNSLYLHVSVTIKKEELDEGDRKIALSFNGGMIVTDLKDNSIVSHMDFSKEKTVFDILETHVLSSNVASTVYRLPIAKMMGMRKIVEENIKLKKSFEILVQGTKNITEVYAFIKMMKEVGLLYYFNAEIASIVDDKVKLVVKYSGEKEKALAVLTKMAKKKVSDNRQVSQNGELPYVFDISDIVTEEEKSEAPESVEVKS
jgi:hypothetical protein